MRKTPIDELDMTSQWAILPAAVRYDQNLPPNAKLLYAEIAAKTSARGYCWASNQWFADRLGLSRDRISGLISELDKTEYITVDIDPARESFDRRRIYLSPVPFAGGIGKNADTPYRQKCRGGIGKNAEALTLYENNNIKGHSSSQTEKLRPKTMAMDVFSAIGNYCGDDAELMVAWLNYAEMRQRIRHPIATVATVERACSKLDKLSSGSRAYKLGVLRKATDNSWQGLYDIKPGDDGYDTGDAETYTGEELPTWT